MVAARRTKPGRTPAADPARRDADPWAMIDVFPLPTFICGPDGALLRYNKRADELWGVAPDTGRGHRFGGAHRLYRADDSPIPIDERPVAQVLRTRRRHSRPGDRSSSGATAAGVRVLASIEPLLDENGARRRGGELHAGHHGGCAGSRMPGAKASSVSPPPMRTPRSASPRSTRTAACCASTRRPARSPATARDELLGIVRVRHHPSGRPRPGPRHITVEQAAGRETATSSRSGVIRKDGRVIWVDVRSSTVRDAAGRFLYGVRVVQDISDRKQAELRQKLLLDELNHRVKNTLATVQSLATQTLRGAGSPEQFRRTFEARIVALSKTHDLLTTRNWQGGRARGDRRRAARALSPSIRRAWCWRASRWH